MNEILKMEGINKIYGEAVSTQVLYDINLSFQAGSFNSIIGQSGSGKSTLLNIMGTLDRPTSGTIQIGEEEISKLSARKLSLLRNDWLGFVFQFHYLLPEFTALENVLIPYEIKHGKVDAAGIKRAKELLNLVGLEEVQNNLATKMSGGQQQRTAIARAMMNQPKIILADEPTGNLDTDSTELVYELMRSINEEFKTTFVIITHDKKIAEKADRIVEIKDGRINIDLSK
ncbi:MAG: ABC transporter ATP-binding protein [Lachnospiraceae bacterium]|nr:ABC transporter ATP-binding protein [Lachnospiraceae bacterium]